MGLLPNVRMASSTISLTAFTCTQPLDSCKFLTSHNFSWAMYISELDCPKLGQQPQQVLSCKMCFEARQIKFS